MYKSTRTNPSSRSRNAAGIFAATVVLTSGVGMCLGIAFVFAPDLWRPVAVVSAGLIALIFLMRALLDRPLRRARDSNLYLAEREGLGEYIESFEPKFRRRRDRTFGTNAPPTVNDLRKIKEDSNSWYPSERRMNDYRRTLGDAGQSPSDA